MWKQSKLCQQLNMANMKFSGPDFLVCESGDLDMIIGRNILTQLKIQRNLIGIEFRNINEFHVILSTFI